MLTNNRLCGLAALAIIGVAAVSCPTAQGPWRSALYPEDWDPAMTDAQGRFLHDFSYAGYHDGEVPIPDSPPGGVFNVVTGYRADATGVGDCTAALQAAIDDAKAAGGGVVFLPAGLYRCDGTLTVTTSGVVIRGAGPEATRVFFTSSAGMTGKAHLTFRGSLTRGPDIPLASDGVNRAFSVQVGDSGVLAEGDDVALGWVISDDFVSEHDMTDVWQAFNGTWRPIFRRTVRGLVAGAKGRQVTLDAPLRYRAKTRDVASVRVESGYLSECGIENLAVSNAVSWDEAWSQERLHAITLNGVKDSWIRNVHSFASPLNQADDFHLQNCGIRVLESKRVTVADCMMANAQNRGGGGCGYLFEVTKSNEVLFRDCHAANGRHNFIQNWDFGTTGCVWLRCSSSGSRNVLSRDLPVGLPAYCEFHHSLAMACLVDSCDLDDGWYGGNRMYWSSGAGHTVTQSVYWNTAGSGRIRSWQFGKGYIIGTEGVTVDTSLLDPSADGSEPADYREGIGRGEALMPRSLYENQLALRLAKQTDF